MKVMDAFCFGEEKQRLEITNMPGLVKVKRAG